jgi:UDP-3-O-acyl N-acetylglucosamine deacetylase
MKNEHLLMDNRRYQTTTAASAAVEGFGYWTGQDVRVEFRPAEPDTGIVFVRSDLPNNPRIQAAVENRVDTPLRTSLRVGDASVDMVEHILAALGGLEIDNCEVWVDQPEMPGCDGSSLPFVEAIDSVGTVLQSSQRRCIEVTSLFCDCEKNSRIEARPSSSGNLELEYHLDYPGTAIGQQQLKLTLTPETFRSELAPSRTFLLQKEAEKLLAQGLGQRASFRDLLVYGEHGPIDNTLRFDDECVRHKLLDMVGDLAMAGASLVGSFSARRSGHHLNARMVRTLLNTQIMVKEYRRCA